MVTGLSDTVLVCGLTIQTAGFGPSAIKAVHGTDICAPGCRLAVPATALPSAIVAGGFWIATLTSNRRALRIDGRRHFPDVTGGRDTRVREECHGDVTGVVIAKENRFVHIEDSVAIAILRQGEYRLSRLHHLADLKTSRGNHARGPGAQFGIAKRVFRCAQLRLGRFKRSFCVA